jgi:DNA-directed RNA polymerase subunit RPC12/RpoP
LQGSGFLVSLEAMSPSFVCPHCRQLFRSGPGAVLCPHCGGEVTVDVRPPPFAPPPAPSPVLAVFQTISGLMLTFGGLLFLLSAGSSSPPSSKLVAMILSGLAVIVGLVGTVLIAVLRNTSRNN